MIPKPGTKWKHIHTNRIYYAIAFDYEIFTVGEFDAGRWTLIQFEQLFNELF